MHAKEKKESKWGLGYLLMGRFPNGSERR